MSEPVQWAHYERPGARDRDPARWNAVTRRWIRPPLCRLL